MKRRNRKKQGSSNVLFKGLLCGILVAGLFMQILMLAEISGKSKERSAMEKEIYRLTEKRDRAQVQLAELRRSNHIYDEAVKLGMQLQQPEQLRVIAMPQEYEDTTAHTAEITGSR